MKLIALTFISFLIHISSFGQVKIGDNLGTIKPSALLELESNDKALIIPRVTNTTAIGTAADGMMIFDKSQNCIVAYRNNSWGGCLQEAGFITDLDCGVTVFSPFLVESGLPYSGTATVSYTGATGGFYNGESVPSTGSTGLTANLIAGGFGHGGGTVVYNITGTPSTVGPASFDISLGGKSCTINLDISFPGSISSLDCASAVFAPLIGSSNSSYSGTATVSYLNPTGGFYYGESVSSTRVTGLTACLIGDNFALNSGTVVYNITGTASSIGTARFNISLGGKSCTMDLEINNPGSISDLHCASAAFAPITGEIFRPYSGTAVVGYSGATDGFYAAESVSSTGSTGLTAYLTGGEFTLGSGTVVYNITGTPSTAGSASFNISLGGESCSMNLDIPSPGIISSLNCGASPSAIIEKNGDYPTIYANYSGGDGGYYYPTSVTSTGVTGLLLENYGGNLSSSSGTVPYYIQGTTAYYGTASFTIYLGGKSCVFSVIIDEIALQLSGDSLNKYLAAGVGQWVAITNSEYNALATRLTAVSRFGTLEGNMMTGSYGAPFPNYGGGWSTVSRQVTFGQDMNPSPAYSYIFAFKMTKGDYISASHEDQVRLSHRNNGTYFQPYGGTLPQHWDASYQKCFVIKTQSINFDPMYLGLTMDSPTLIYYSAYGTSGYYDMDATQNPGDGWQQYGWSMQGLSTTIKQW